MTGLVPVAGMMLVAAITPGPNNLVVTRAAARAGLRGALPALAGIVAGGVALLLVVTAGAGEAFVVEPRLRMLVVLAGSAYLSWAGLTLLRSAAAHSHIAPSRATDSRSSAALSMFGFQFLNPKAWVMMLTAASAAPEAAHWQLAAVFVLVSAPSLTIWAALGSALSHHLARPTLRRWFDATMGALLVLSALALVADS